MASLSPAPEAAPVSPVPDMASLSPTPEAAPVSPVPDMASLLPAPVSPVPDMASLSTTLEAATEAAPVSPVPDMDSLLPAPVSSPHDMAAGLATPDIAPVSPTPDMASLSPTPDVALLSSALVNATPSDDDVTSPSPMHDMAPPPLVVNNVPSLSSPNDVPSSPVCDVPSPLHANIVSPPSPVSDVPLPSPTHNIASPSPSDGVPSPSLTHDMPSLSPTPDVPSPSPEHDASSSGHGSAASPTLQHEFISTDLPDQDQLKSQSQQDDQTLFAFPTKNLKGQPLSLLQADDPHDRSLSPVGDMNPSPSSSHENEFIFNSPISLHESDSIFNAPSFLHENDSDVSSPPPTPKDIEVKSHSEDVHVVSLHKDDSSYTYSFHDANVLSETLPHDYGVDVNFSSSHNDDTDMQRSLHSEVISSDNVTALKISELAETSILDVAEDVNVIQATELQTNVQESTSKFETESVTESSIMSQRDDNEALSLSTENSDMPLEPSDNREAETENKENSDILDFEDTIQKSHEDLRESVKDALDSGDELDIISQTESSLESMIIKTDLDANSNTASIKEAGELSSIKSEIVMDYVIHSNPETQMDVLPSEKLTKGESIEVLSENYETSLTEETRTFQRSVNTPLFYLKIILQNLLLMSRCTHL
ncbi:histone-lysine N-methyltransferase 2D-like [Penaeus monodon]|uniref:histone-lysine N-methyltransferase 2D-like n=1 Tax=Penaeus monodon TaxID=6687 RepID=UPI0018A744C5|nr:histone-lysine N-methyltransferase 2D-like [Penaeus monodon]